MTKIKLCGLSREEDIEAVNVLKPDYIGFVFVNGSKRFVSPEKALRLRKKLFKGIVPVGVFVNEEIDTISKLVSDGIIDVVQLHGNEDESYIKSLKEKCGITVIKAFKVSSAAEISAEINSSADYIMLDSGAGTGKTFNIDGFEKIKRDCFVAGGLDENNVGDIVERYSPYAVDVSSGIETNGKKDAEKMKKFVNTVRKRAQNHD